MIEIKGNDAVSNMKMLIVDDEELARKGLAVYFNWEEFHIDEIYQADGYNSALEIIKKKKPDIVLTDIKMPDVDGIELIRRVKKYIPQAEYIIVSGYDDFEYAKQAISIGVFNYIIKPVYEKEFRQVIEKCVEFIVEKKNKELLEKSLVKKLKQSIPILRDSYVRNILINRMEEIEELEQTENKLFELEIDIISNYYSAIYIKALSNNNCSNVSKDKINIYIKSKIQNLLSEYKEKEIKNYTFIDGEMVVTIISWAENTIITEEIINTVFTRIRLNVEEIFNCSIIISIGAYVNSLSQLHQSAESTLKIIKEKYFLNQGKIFFYNNYKENDVDKPYFMSGIIKKNLQKNLEINNIEGIKSEVDNLKREIQNIERVSSYDIYTNVLEFIIYYTRIFYKNGFYDNELYKREQFSFEFLSQFLTLESLFSWFTQYLILFAEKFNEFSSQTRKKNTIQEIKKYIQENVYSNITLDKISDRFFYNSCYISRVFKMETGMNFIEFVNKTKIDKAIELLKNSNLISKEVCIKLAFNDYKHFSEIFRRFTGKTPGEYKKLCI